MPPQSSPAAQALSLEFIADLSYNPRTHQYRFELREPYRSDLPRDRNFLLIDVDGFSVERLLDAFQHDVVNYYQTKCDEAQQNLDRLRHQAVSSPQP